MKIIFAMVALLPLTTFSAGVNKCTTPDGETVYQSAPCSGSQGIATDIQTHGYKPADLDYQTRPNPAMESLRRMREINQQENSSQHSQRRAANQPSLPDRNQLSNACGRRFHSHSKGADMRGLEHLLSNRQSSQHADKDDIEELKCRLRQFHVAQTGQYPEHLKEAPKPASRFGPRYYDQQRKQWCQMVGNRLYCN